MLTRPGSGGATLIGDDRGRAWAPQAWILAVIVVLYGVYGFGLGLYRGWLPGLVSALKLPLLYLLTLAVCFPPFYVLNCLTGPRIRPATCLRLLFLAVSANAVAVFSYAPVSYFFTLTTSSRGYAFLVLMHVSVFAAASGASLAVSFLLFRSVAGKVGRPLGLSMVTGWAVTYAVVIAQMSWVLRPWLTRPETAYTPLRPIGGSFVEGVWTHISSVLGP